MTRGLFITSTGTSAGKTFVTRALTFALRGLGLHVAALKPIETGCAPDALDAIALAGAAGNPALAHALGFYRVEPPLAPYAATLEVGVPAPDLEAIVARIQALASRHDRTLVEGAGGLLVPLDRHNDIADLARRLGYPVLLVAPNQLGVIASVRATYEAALARGLTIAAVVLTHPGPEPDPSARTNPRILGQLLEAPVCELSNTPAEPAQLIAAVAASGLLEVLEPTAR